MFILLCVMSVTAGMAQDVKLRHDTLRIYSSWQSLMNDAPHTLLVNPVLTYGDESNRLNISSAGGQSKKFVEANIKQSMAVVLIADSISSCYANCAWLNKYMEEGVGQLGYEGFLPMYFNGKMAYVVLSDYFYPTRWERDVVVYQRYYHLDFEKRCVHEITPKYLLSLLNRYPDLRLRYEGSKRKKDEDMINDFLEKYMNRIAADVMVPYIDEVLTENE